jgi:hypothetical protein
MAALASHWLNRRVVRNWAIRPAGAGLVGSDDQLDVPDRFSARHAPAFRPKPSVRRSTGKASSLLRLFDAEAIRQG